MDRLIWYTRCFDGLILCWETLCTDSAMLYYSLDVQLSLSMVECLDEPGEKSSEERLQQEIDSRTTVDKEHPSKVSAHVLIS